MQRKHELIGIGLIALLIIGLSFGCRALFGTTASAGSIPVVTGAATTNDTALVAYIKGAASVNNAVPSPYQPVITAGLDTLMAIAGYIGGRIHAAAQKGQVANAPGASPTKA